VIVTATKTVDSLTTSVEDYLKAIYRISRGGGPASTSEIAAALGLSAPSVTGMIKRLSDQGLLEHVPYKGAELTAAGRLAALKILRRHRLIESYLVGFLGYSWDSVHEEAERLEHAVSDRLIERMSDALGNPLFDPHGDPIPAADGSIPELSYTALPNVEIGETVELRRVDSNDPDQLRYIASLGLKPGVVFTVTDRQPFQGPVTICLDEKHQVVGFQLAGSLLCREIEAGN
jgi:DtxR family Mn-dependent transcriptional regulator